MYIYIYTYVYTCFHIHSFLQFYIYTCTLIHFNELNLFQLALFFVNRPPGLQRKRSANPSTKPFTNQCHEIGAALPHANAAAP